MADKVTRLRQGSVMESTSIETLPKALPQIIPVRYCLYARKSTERDEKQALSIESQIKEMLQIAGRDNLDVIDIRREAHSAKASSTRPVYNEILKDLREGRFNGILVWHPDRLSRNAGDLGSLVDLMDQKSLVEIRTYGQSFTNSPSEKFLLMILCSQAKLDNDNKSVNVKRGLRMRCEMGLWPAPAPTGYLNENRADRRGHVLIDPERAQIIRQMFEKVANEKWTGRKVYHWLKFEINFKTPQGNKNLTLSNVYKILNTPFYYGQFEYPSKSGNWYQGKHEPIITKELFEQVKNQLKRDYIVRGETKEFAFTKLITCGLCGSGVSAEEKFKFIKSTGLNARYVYYGCSRSRDRNCKGGYMREEELIKDFIGLLDSIDFNQIDIQNKFKEELIRFNKFQNSVLGTNLSKAVVDLDFKSYMKYILKDGTNYEKREIMGCMRSKIILKNKSISIKD
ncbi:MAG: recombinase family protein [Candidatus Paceibacterota bacterium]